MNNATVKFDRFEAPSIEVLLRGWCYLYLARTELDRRDVLPQHFLLRFFLLCEVGGRIELQEILTFALFPLWFGCYFDLTRMQSIHDLLLRPSLLQSHDISNMEKSDAYHFESFPGRKQYMWQLLLYATCGLDLRMQTNANIFPK